MATTTITGSNLLDFGGLPLSGSANFTANGSITVGISDGSCSGTVPSGAYPDFSVNDGGVGVVATPITAPDDATLDLTETINGAWCVLAGSTWIALAGGDLLVVAADVVLPRVPNALQGLGVVNGSGSAITVSAAAGIGNGATPPTSLSLASLGALDLRWDGTYWRIAAISTSPQ